MPSEIAPPPILAKLGFLILALTLLSSISTVRPFPSVNYIISILSIMNPQSLLPDISPQGQGEGSQANKFYSMFSLIILVTVTFDIIYLIINAPEITDMSPDADHATSTKFSLTMYIFVLMVKVPVMFVVYEMNVKVNRERKELIGSRNEGVTPFSDINSDLEERDNSGVRIPNKGVKNASPIRNRNERESPYREMIANSPGDIQLTILESSTEIL